MSSSVIGTSFDEIILIQRRDLEEEDEIWRDWTTAATEEDAKDLRDSFSEKSRDRWDWRAVRKIITTVTVEVA